MIAHAADADRHKNPHDCGCGCGGTCACENRCCDLQCLIRPNYFCGQTLTDRDLTALVEWARSRFGLVRYRQGWGAVCGLDITCTGPDLDDCCGREEGKGPVVFVHPGYAIDCCGNDLVVCDPFRVDLSSICVEYGDPCSELREDKVNGAAPVPKGDGFDNGVDAGRTDDERKRLEEAISVDPCLPWKDRTQLFAVDLTLRYHEDLAQGQRTMFRNKCADAQPCGHSRIVERPCVHLDVTQDFRGSPEEREAEDWEADFGKEAVRRIQELRAAIINRDPREVLRYVRQHPPATLCFVEDYICCLIDQVKVRGVDWQITVGSWLLVDWMLQRLRCQCWSCRPDAGVRIGRVMLRRIKVGGRVRCRVVHIDTGPRYRRELRKGCRPLRQGTIDLAPYLWQPLSDVRTHLATRGVKISDAVRQSASTKEAFSPGLLAVEPGREVRPMAMEDPLGVPRVTAFFGGQNT